MVDAWQHQRMSPDRSDQHRWLPVLTTVVVLAALGLATEWAGGVLQAVDGREKIVWLILGGVVVLAVVVDLAKNGSVRLRRRRLGRRVQDFSAADLELHDPVEVPDQRLPEQTKYVRRSQDERLASAVKGVLGGASQMVTLVGDSSTGKTRACHEAVQYCRSGGGCGTPSIHHVPRLCCGHWPPSGPALWCGSTMRPTARTDARSWRRPRRARGSGTRDPAKS